MDNGHALIVGSTVTWLESLHVPDTEPFVYIPVLLEQLAIDYLDAPEVPKMGPGTIRVLKGYGYTDKEAVELSQIGMASLHNEIASIPIDRKHHSYGCRVYPADVRCDMVYVLHVFRYSDHRERVFETTRRFALERAKAKAKLENALREYMDVHLLEDVEDAFTEFTGRRRSPW